ncbi:MAG: chromosome segregation protein SMC [Eubacteriales bacterium]|nr:chromosome segregation protein SMC [Eubacteriales bacterium]
MYLKSIEIQGFKSFANKMKFQFHNGITGIVGPNGSGKSNVGDAVRWVLGEQSAKQLRGGNMQDVIFAGTENRKPLGFAMVSITLDNGDHQLPVDYEEVTVTRRLYRSGESEYLINGTNCRLKDINEMFYDTGIGKEGYSIIGQGQIDKILSGKPEERRELFDEAAGIVKFKRRKLTAQKKLESEEGNLTRVNDILSELTRQIGPLERQSEKARIYLKKREELKHLDINMFLMDMERTGGQLQEVARKQEISDHDLEETKAQMEQTRIDYEKLETELEALNQAIEQKQSQLGQGKVVRQQLESQVDLLREQIRSAQSNDEHFLGRIHVIEHEMETRRKDYELAKESQEELRLMLKEAVNKEQEDERQAMSTAAQVATLEQEIAQGQAELIDLLNEQANTKAKMQRYTVMKEQIQIRGAELTSRLLRAKNEQEEFAKSRMSLQEDYSRVQESIAELRRENSGLEQELKELQGRLTQLSARYEEARTAYHREASRMESLRNITERYDGYGNSIRRVMEQKSRQPGLHGVVADLIKTEKKYELAVETALGGSIQNIVTDNENTAKTMIAFLKQNKYGRATFLPLNVIRKKGGLGSENAIYEPGAIGVASTLVDTEDTYEELVEYLLGKTLVVDHIDHAIAISRKYRQSLRIVTLDGELLSAGGSISGGAFKNSSNLLGRRREVDELEQKVSNLRESMQKLQKEIEESRNARQERRERQNTLNEEIQREYLLQNTAKLRLEEVDSQNEKTRTGHEQLARESAEIKKQMQEIEGEQESIRGMMADSESQRVLLEKNISEKQEILEERRRQQEEETLRLSETRTGTAGLRQREEFIQQNLTRLQQELSQFSSEKDEMEKNVQNSAGDTQEKEQKIEEIRTAIAQAEIDEQEMLSEAEELSNDRKKKTEIHRDFFRRREELSTQMSNLDKERFRLDTQRERLEDYRERQINYMWEEYEITFSEAEKYKDDSQEDPAALKKAVSQLKTDIKSLGPVNVNAIEEYKELAERHEFLSAQHADLVKAGDALKKIIEELDAGMRRQFKEKFAQMQSEFSKSFKELFGGGKGTLELVEDEDILEAGVIINAQPPGKKLQNMMQMSGGEKALTAIALLFAIQNMKPSPFCLLDEIEAALDENNVSRYAEYLHKLTKNTQFIIITHRRGTMAAADRLYGITMQEKGVSAQVSVNMVEGELDQ